MGEPAVTALVTSYNHGRYIAAAVDSILSQGYGGEVEIVVVEDGSTDDSLDVLAGFGNRVRVVRQQNEGQLLALRTGFAEATGEIICLLDSDDAWFPDKLASVRSAFRDPSVQWVSHGLAVCDGGGAATGEVIGPAGRAGRVPGDPILFLERRAGTAASGLCFRASLAGRFVTSIAGLAVEHAGLLRYDADRILLALTGVERADGLQISAPLGWYRRHAGQQFAGADRRLAMIERQIAVDRIVAAVMSSRLGKPLVPTPLYRHELVRSGILGERGRGAQLLTGLARAARFAPRRPLLAARQAASLLYAYLAPGRWLAKRAGPAGEAS